MPLFNSVSTGKTNSGVDSSVADSSPTVQSRLLKPLIDSGSLNEFKQQDVTPVIGREFEGLQVTDLLKWGDEKIKDLAIISMSNSICCMAGA